MFAAAIAPYVCDSYATERSTAANQVRNRLEEIHRPAIGSHRAIDVESLVGPEPDFEEELRKSL
jgi:hypothetical protein